MPSQLQVYSAGRRVGRLWLTPQDRMEFQYDENWLQSADAVPISVSLPLQPDVFTAAADHYFANLLPEADVRQRLCQRLQVTPGNDFELLRRIGGECAGALTLVDETTPRQPESEPAEDYREIATSQLAQWSLASKPDAFSSTVGRDGVRLSLAGAQDKLPVRIDGERILLPIGTAPSTHLLKFATGHFKQLPENEWFVTRLASSIGLPAVHSTLIKPRQGAYLLVVERYDRTLNDGRIERLHQEDFCQALGRSPLRKYEKEGGPGLAEMAELLRQQATLPAIELTRLLQWALFNWLVGNSDGHAKNLSLLIGPQGTIGLAPFYDLVCTRVYPAVDRHLALSLGGKFDPGQIARRDLEQLARDLQIGSRLVLDSALDICDRLQAQLQPQADQFHDRFGAATMPARIQRQVRQNIRRARTQLKAV